MGWQRRLRQLARHVPAGSAAAGSAATLAGQDGARLSSREQPIDAPDVRWDAPVPRFEVGSAEAATHLDGRRARAAGRRTRARRGIIPRCPDPDLNAPRDKIPP